MATEHISVRLPAEVVAALRAEALELERSVSWVIVRRLRSSVPQAAGPIPAAPDSAAQSGEGAAVRGQAERPSRLCAQRLPILARGAETGSRPGARSGAASGAGGTTRAGRNCRGDLWPAWRGLKFAGAELEA